VKSKSELAIADLEAVVQIGLDLLLQSSDNLTIQVSTLLHAHNHALVATQFCNNNNNNNIINNNSILLSVFCQTQNILQLGFH
jgi:hypothetical protein